MKIYQQIIRIRNESLYEETKETPDPPLEAESKINNAYKKKLISEKTKKLVNNINRKIRKMLVVF